MHGLLTSVMLTELLFAPTGAIFSMQSAISPTPRVCIKSVLSNAMVNFSPWSNMHHGYEKAPNHLQYWFCTGIPGICKHLLYKSHNMVWNSSLRIWNFISMDN